MLTTTFGIAGHEVAIGLPSKQDLLDAVRPDRFLGRGTTNAAYELPGYPDLILRGPVSALQGLSAENLSAEIVLLADPFHGVNVGQAVAQYGPGITVNRRQHGQPLSVNTERVFKKMESPSNSGWGTLDNSPKIEKPTEIDWQDVIDAGILDKTCPLERQRALDETRSLTQRLAGMPMESYVGLMRDLQTIKTADHEIDPSKSNNLIVDFERQTFGWVDINEAGGCQSSVESVLSMMLGPAGATRSFITRDEHKALMTELDPALQTISDNLKQAASVVGIPLLTAYTARLERPSNPIGPLQPAH